MSNRYSLEQREIIKDIKTILGGILDIPSSIYLLISVHKPFDEMMNSMTAMSFIQELRNKYMLELCWGRISDNPTIDGLLEVISDETDGNYKCNS